MINNQNLAVLSEKVAHLESAVKNSDEASEISYDNTESGLTADDVQAAIDEIAPALTAEGTSYDNTDSGLTATNTQDAIDEVLSKLSGKISFAQSSTFVKSAETTSGSYPTDKPFIITATAGTSQSPIVSLFVPTTTILNRRLYIGDGSIYFNMYGAFDMSAMDNGTTVIVTPINI